MDKKWASVYFQELYEKCVARGQYAIATGDYLSIDTANESRLPLDRAESDAWKDSEGVDAWHLLEKEDFNDWCALQNTLMATNCAEREAAQFEYEYRKRVNIEQDSESYLSGAVREITGLQDVSGSEEQLGDQNMLDLDEYLSSNFKSGFKTDALKQLMHRQEVLSEIPDEEFSQEYLLTSDKIYQSLLKAYQDHLAGRLDVSEVLATMPKAAALLSGEDLSYQIRRYLAQRVEVDGLMAKRPIPLAIEPKQSVYRRSCQAGREL